MPRSLNAARSAATHAHALLCLLIVLTVLRAFIPAGFMPDPAALAQGHFALMPCPAAGGMPKQQPAGMSMHGDGHAHGVGASGAGHAEATHHVAHLAQTSPAEASADGRAFEHAAHAAQADHNNAAASLDCPYSLLTQVSADLPTPVALDTLPGPLAAITAVPPQPLRPIVAGAGPPLGSRAPPFLQV